MRRVFAATFVALIGTGWMLAPQEGPRLVARQDVQLPAAPASLKFAVLGDTGTGGTAQFEVGRQMAAARARFPFDLVIMLGDNMYGRQEPRDFVTKFERPYAALLNAGVPFYASLGNHDHQNNRFYKAFNMGGERYYTFARNNVRFFVFDSNLMDRKQLAWIDETMQQAQEPWKICYFHHPLYSSGGRHGPDVELRVLLEPLLVRHGADVVFAGHEHIYERTHPQKGITHFIDGAGGQLRTGDVTRSSITAAAFDQDYTFMLVEVEGDTMFFQAVTRTGRIVDSGVIRQSSS
jgi:3',5'-cyclic AMP phosphodiesterase CpdA